MIATLSNLYWLTQHSEHWDKHYKQLENINAEQTKLWDEKKGFKPIGNETTKFTGTYNGQGSVISKLTINRPDTDYVGLFGFIEESTAKIENIGLTRANIIGKSYVGGIAGRVYQSTISHCYVLGKIVGTGTVGGIVGSNSAPMDNVYSMGSVTGSARIGGIIGYQTFSTLNNAYSNAKITANSGYGSLVGVQDNGNVNNSYWDKEIYGQTTSTGSPDTDGKTSGEMKQQSTFTDWDFNNTWSIDENTNAGYPTLQPPAEFVPTAEEPEGTGTEDNPYKIANLNNLYWMSQNGYALSSYLKNNKITNLQICRTNNNEIGLFGYAENASIKNLGIEDDNIIGYYNVGAIVGNAINSTLNKLYNTGNISGSFLVGGIAGSSTGTVTNVYNTGNVIGNRYACR